MHHAHLLVGADRVGRQLLALALQIGTNLVGGRLHHLPVPRLLPTGLLSSIKLHVLTGQLHLLCSSITFSLLCFFNPLAIVN